MKLQLLHCWFTLALVVLSSQVSGVQQKAKSVTTLLDAKWEETPVVLEIAEFIGEESEQDFWTYVDLLSEQELELVQHSTDKAQYETALELASRVVSSLQLNILKLAVSLRIYSAKMEMYNQMASERGLPESCCPAAIDYNDRLYCHMQEFLTAFRQTGGKGTKIETYKIDHYYPRVGGGNASTTVVLYGELGTAMTAEMHRAIKQLAQSSDIDYVFRHYVKERPQRRVRLSGYGVELQMKSTEYKVMDDSEVKEEDGQSAADADDPDEEIEGLNFYTLKNLYPEKKASLDLLRAHLLESSNEMAPLKVWQVQELSLQAAERILSAGTGDEALRTMTHLAQNFPLQARSLVRNPVRAELKADVARHRELFSSHLNLAPSDTGLFINGMYHDMEMADVFTLLGVARQELRAMERLHAAGLSDAAASALLAVDLATSTQDYAIDIRDSAVFWINDIENDAVYRKWSDSLLDLLRPTFPGMLRSVRRNLYNLVLIVDPSTAEAKPLLKLAESFYIHRAPLRIGLVLAVGGRGQTGLESAGVAMLNAFNYVSTNTNSANEPLSIITDIYSAVPDGRDLVPEDVHKKLKDKYPNIDIEDVFGEDSSYDFGRILADEFQKKSGLRKLPQALLNGNPLSEKLLNGEDFEDAVLTEMMSQTPQLQKAVFRGDLSDTDNVVDYLMTRPNVMPRLNERVLSEHAVHIDLTVASRSGGSTAETAQSAARLLTSQLLSNLRYFTNKPSKKPDLISHWLVADLDSSQGRDFLRQALTQMSSSSSIRVALLVNPEADKVTPLTELILTAVTVLPSDLATSYVTKILDNEAVFESLDGFKTPPNFNIEGVDQAELESTLVHGKAAATILKLHKQFVGTVLHLKPGQRAVVTNGRLFGPLDDGEDFLVDDFALLDKFSTSSYGEKILDALKKAKTEDGGVDVTSDMLMQTVSILTSRPSSRARFTIPVKSNADPPPLNLVTLPPTSEDLPFFDIVAIVDPVSRGAQKVAPILSVLHQALNANIRVFLNCVDKSSDFPLKSFYKFVLEPELKFNHDGSLSDGPTAHFSNLPSSVLLTQAMHVPENWLVESVRSPYDLDNIKLEDILHHNVYSEFELEYLLLEGHCFEANLDNETRHDTSTVSEYSDELNVNAVLRSCMLYTVTPVPVKRGAKLLEDTTEGNPPRGLQITLGTETNPTIYDTIVMANLGYFQLKANPGAWLLRLRQGRSSEIYNIVSHEGSDTPDNSTDIKVIISSLTSHVLKLKVQKKPDKLNMDLLSEDSDPNSGIWNSITSSFGSKVEEEGDGVINIFSLASGHLYERFIKIMMLSVLKNTKTPVKFWFLKNYLSPTVKDFLPHMAAEYKFEYELVQYKWPRWLHQQTEKQRIIWGYKILFLDVLFPLHVKKIIFVDADQVVRADMKELRDLDLGGAPYGYTPFCNSRREMDGFRFWNTGYWKNHLQGRRYHISALYVVDLRRFRRIAAGDRLRGQYQALSQDPNSLSNLDQDLPNNMIHQVAIKSLPQEWLWCETWCDDATKSQAKTIDLCNNPLTKEAKLTAAVRIVSEWKDYDNEIKLLQRRIDTSAPTEDQINIPQQPQAPRDIHTEL